MIISDKQALRRCLKQLVRHADVVEPYLDFDVENGEMGVAAMLSTWTGSVRQPGESLWLTGSTTPLTADAAAMFSALEALELPVHDLDRADMIQKTYTREAYLREILDVMHARCVLVRVPLEKAEAVHFDDDRLSPLLEVGDALFSPGRYGVPYEAAAGTIREAAAACQARHILAAEYDRDQLAYCLLPACEDDALTLHIHLETAEQIEAFADLLDGFAHVRAIVSAPEELEPKLIAAAERRMRMTVCLRSFDHLSLAFAKLGTRFVPYTSRAILPEQMLGRWTAAREILWQALCDVYLPLARSGYELTSDAIAEDVKKLLCGNIEIPDTVHT